MGNNRMFATVTLVVIFVYFVANTISLAVVTRSEWGANPSKLVECTNGSAPHVLIHHSYIPAHCNNTDDCKRAMRSMQNFHQNERGWNDIGYNFAIGGDGQIYEGRGFSVIGAHAPKYNVKSVGICLIGDWSDELPPSHMIENVHRLIEFGVSTGKIQENYTLLGHRQVRNTQCPGDKLFKEISTWKHFEALPRVFTDDNV
ncbi:peptidoglycan-recognition protein LB [Bradysia coprophila]|uniref:peptidoglycan-recognition protein LB n=1 Tax=Bradysia coprophila TaxID=38358 RepID=UPI00187D7617|nr:peptidoglycan-recognition protein LB [Bradysia coprophila]